MKRIAILLLACLMLAACQPTPEDEYVVNKGDNTVEEKLNATPKMEESTVELQPAASAANGAEEPPALEPPKPAGEPVEALAPQRFPDRWDEDAADVNANVSIAVHADVIQKADGLYPVYRTKDAPLSEQDAQTLASKLLDKPTEAFTSEMTKEDWKNQLQSYLDQVAAWEEWVAAGSPGGEDCDDTGYTPEQVEAQTNWYMEKIRNAPDAPEAKPVSDYSGLKKKTETVYTTESGEKAFVSYKRSFEVYKGLSYYGNIYGEAEYQIGKAEGEPIAKLWHDVTMEREAAEAILNTQLARLDLADYSVSFAERACLLERAKSGMPTYRSSGWSFTLTRNPAGYPASEWPWEPSQFLNYGSGEGFAANEPVEQEHVTVYIDEIGMQAFGLYNRREVAGLPNANVELLSFADVQRIVKNALAACVSYNGMGDTKVALEIYRIMLTTYTLRVMDSEEYYEMPCWVVFFDYQGGNEDYRMRMRESTFETHEVLLINAIDGSVIHPDFGY